jgi:hypothetical protein
LMKVSILSSDLNSNMDTLATVISNYLLTQIKR